MTLRDDISRLLDDDRLQDAIGLAREHVKTKPTDKDGRHFYIDLLVLAGDYEKADAQCNLAATFSPQESVGFSLFRHQLRAMAARNAWFETGAVPDFPGGPSELDQLAIRANIAARSGDVQTLKKIYSAHLKKPEAREEMDELAALTLKAGPVCLLCYERDHTNCHRTFIAEIIEKRGGVTVENLRPPQH